MTASEDVLTWPFPPGEHGTPPPLYAELRAQHPVCPVRMPSGSVMWLLTRREDIRAVAADHRRFTRNLTYPHAPRISGEDFNSVKGGIFNLDPPDHTRIRSVLAPFYTRTSVAGYADVIRHHARDLLQAMTDGINPTDLMTSYAEPLALRFNCQMLGISPRLRQKYHEFFRVQTNQTGEQESVADATEQISAMAREVIAAKEGASSTDGPIGALIHAYHRGVLSHEELIGTVDYLMVTGVDPLISPTGTFTATLLRLPGYADRMIAHPDGWPPVVDELLRYHHNGYLSNPRVATEDVELHGVRIRKGDAVVTPFLAACWDPSYYSHPEKVDASRENDGLTFGHGPHYCLGASLARLYLHIAMQELFGRFPTLTLAVAADEVPWDDDILFTRPTVLPVAW